MSQPVLAITLTANSAQAQQNILAFVENVNHGFEKLTRVGDFMEEIAAKLAAAFTVGKLVELTKGAIEGAAEMEKLKDQTDLSVVSLTSLKLVSGQIGRPFENITPGLSIFTQKIDQAVKNGGALAKTFRDLKIQLTDNEGVVFSTDKILADTITKLKEMDGRQRVAAARELFGRGGAQALPVFMQDNPLGRASADAAQFAKDSEEVEQGWNRVGQVFKNIFVQFSKELIPALKEANEWLLDFAKENDVAATAAHNLMDFVQGLAFTVDLIRTLFMVAGEIIGNYFAIALQATTDHIKLLTLYFLDLQGLLTSIIVLFLDLTDAANTSARVAFDVATGQFKKALDEPREKLAQIMTDLKNVGAGFKAGFTDAFQNIGALTGGMWNNFKTIGVQTLKDVAKQLEDFGNRSLDRFKPRQETYKMPAWMTSGFDPNAGHSEGESVMSEEAKRLAEKIAQEYAQATQSRIKLLDLEEAKMKKQVDDEVVNLKKADELKSQITEIFAQRRAELKLKSIEKVELAEQKRAETLRRSYEQNPYLDDAQKREKSIEFIQAEIEANQKLMDAQRARAQDESANEEDRQNAQAKLNDGISKQIELLYQKQDVEDQTSAKGSFGRVFAQMSSEAEVNWKKIATTFKNIFDGAVSSISNGITGLIMKTKTWGQAFQEIGNSILTSVIGAIVQMGVKWVATQLFMAVTGKGIAAAATAALIPIAAAQAEVWATPAALADTASYGEASAQAPFDIAAAIAATMDIAAFAMGGRPTPGQLAMIGERGPELWVPDEAGTIIPNNKISSFTQGGSRGQLESDGSAVHVVVVDSMESARRYQKKHGKAFVVETAKRYKGEIGIKS